MKLKIISLNFFILICGSTFAQKSVSDTIRVLVKEFKVANSDKEASVDGQHLAQLVNFGFYKSPFIKSTVSLESSMDFIIQGNADFFNGQFYLSVSITDKANKIHSGPSISGDTKNLLKEIDNLNNQLNEAIFSIWNDSGNFIKVALILPPSAKKMLSSEKAITTVYSILTDQKKFGQWKFWDWPDFVKYKDSSKIDEKIKVFVEFDLRESSDNSSIAIARIKVQQGDKSLAVPVSILSKEHDYIFSDTDIQFPQLFKDDVNQLITELIDISGNVDSNSIGMLSDSVRKYPNNSISQLLRSSDAIGLSAKDTDSYLILSKERFKQNRLKDAFLAAYKYVNQRKRSDDLNEAKLILGEIFFMKGMYNEAYSQFIDIYRAKSDYYNPDFGFIETSLGKTLYSFPDSLAQAELVLSNLKNKISTDSSHLAEGLYYYARTLKKNKKYNEAVAAFILTKKYDPDINEILVHDLADSYYELGKTAYDLRDFQNAKAHLIQANSIKETDFNISKLLILTFFQLKEFREADDRLSKSKLLNLTYYDWAVMTKSIFYEYTDRNDRDGGLDFAEKTLELVNKNLEKKPSHISSMWLKGNTLVNLLRLPEGIELLEKVHESDTTKIGYRLDFSEALLMNYEVAKADKVMSEWFLKRIPSKTKSGASNQLIGHFLKYVITLVLVDSGLRSELLAKEYEALFSKYSKKEITLVNWDTSSFEIWLSRYEGASKGHIQDLSKPLKKK